MRTILLVVMWLFLTALVARGQESSGYTSADGAARDPRQFVDEYAPVLHYDDQVVRYLPTGFSGDSSGTCCYVNIVTEPGFPSANYTFQYWFYYEKDVRFTEAMDLFIRENLPRVCDAVLKAQPGVCASIFEEIQQTIPGVPDLEALWEKAFHDHDWEMVSVKVAELGQLPIEVAYGSHGRLYSYGANCPMLNGSRIQVQLLTDMHASYPPTGQLPDSWESQFEATVAAALLKVHCGTPSPGTLDFSGNCREFTPSMLSAPDVADFPYPWPWNNGFRYSSH
ncbi:hypothetical protein HZA57_01455 [Candidatus Poribacteria bacterium]|nr:hypothetical protein [Candidatus Poribacteria bacterium]